MLHRVSTRGEKEAEGLRASVRSNGRADAIRRFGKRRRSGASWTTLHEQLHSTNDDEEKETKRKDASLHFAFFVSLYFSSVARRL